MVPHWSLSKINFDHSASSRFQITGFSRISGFFLVQTYMIEVISGICLDQIKTRFESGLGLDKIQISFLKLKTLKIRKIANSKNIRFEKLNFENFSMFSNFQFFNTLISICFEFCPDSVQTEVWYQTKIWTLKNPDSGRNLDLYRWWTTLLRSGWNFGRILS